ncbi:MAG TPA: BTAD domain-containing putative transcriptional regulator [Roseiflexaceae bacterium]|nr:BTAD domain-containing putative transcriptional regulator [Roseiflexaceae bacterium]
MEARFRIQLFGSFQVERGDGTAIRVDSRKGQALLAYLVRQQRPPEREHLAVLLWSNLPGARARRNLSRELSLLNTCLQNCFHSDYHTVGWAGGADLWVDTAALERHIADPVETAEPGARQAALPIFSQTDDSGPRSLQRELPPSQAASLTSAVELYRGEFLAGFYLDGCPEFETWLLLERERWHLRVTTILDLLIAHHTLRGESSQAINLARRWLMLEPWHEEPHRHLIQLLAQSDRRVEALAQYELCRRTLASQLGVAPSDHLTALYEQIRAGTRHRKLPERSSPALVAASGTVSSSGQGGIAPEHDWGDAPARQRLGGREDEIRTLLRWITDERRRVVGLWGMGGVGKTALAAHVAREAADGFDAVIWWSLRNAPPLDALLRLCSAPLAPQQPALPARVDEQLALVFQLLRRHRCLLVLDRYERILQGHVRVGRYLPGYEIYGQLLQRAVETPHQSCILLTSREQPRELPAFADSQTAVALAVEGLSAVAAQELLGQRAGESWVSSLTEIYSGNPQLLLLAAEAIRELFGGEGAAFVQADAPLLDDMRELLDQQWVRLSTSERQIALWLATASAPVAASTLQHCLSDGVPGREVLDALRSLVRRSLVVQQGQGFWTPSIVRAYARELRAGSAGSLREH